jgi:aerobic-type carbon monoxide dehydrogenase small subunit (CoxS/CutS family)
LPRMTVNGRPVEYLMEPDTPLLWALRDASNLTGTKYGCGVGDCGACMVHVDGEALRSCLITIAEAEGRFVTTIEGLSRDRSHPVQQALVAEQAIQCGFCTPGIAMAASALLERNSVAERGGDRRRRSPICAAAGSIPAWSAPSSAPGGSRGERRRSAPRPRPASARRMPRAGSRR